MTRSGCRELQSPHSWNLLASFHDLFSYAAVLKSFACVPQAGIAQLTGSQEQTMQAFEQRQSAEQDSVDQAVSSEGKPLDLSGPQQAAIRQSEIEETQSILAQDKSRLSQLTQLEGQVSHQSATIDNQVQQQQVSQKQQHQQVRGSESTHARNAD